LIIRRFEPADAGALHAYSNDPEVARYQDWDYPETADKIDGLVREWSTADLLFGPGTATQFAIERRREPGLIGDIGVRIEPEEPTAELGFTLARGHWNQGYATEAVTAVVDYVLATLPVERVVAVAHVDNERSHRVLHRTGLQPVALDGDWIVFLRRAESSPPQPDL
jgi:aminoglycoside 6'-N-acetyltransferase